MPQEKNNNNSIGQEMSVLESLLTPELRLVKKYLLDSQGRLRLYHPVTQRVLFKMLRENLLEEVKKYHAAEKKEKKEKE